MKKRIQKYLAGEREGFSLVELIIVIAIMAILIGVIALAVIPNIQRSRESKDLQALDNVASAVNIAVANNQVSGGGTVTITKAGAVSCTYTNSSDSNASAKQTSIAKSVTSDLGGENNKVSIKLTSSAASEYNNIVATWTIKDNGAATVVVQAEKTAGAALPCKYTTGDDGTTKTFKTGNESAATE